MLILPEDVPFPPEQLPIVLWQAGGPGESVSNTWNTTMEVPVSLLPNFEFGVLVAPLYGRFGFSAERYNALAGTGAFGAIDIDALAEIGQQLRDDGWASKLGIVGCSYGGYFVTQSVARHPTAYDAAHTMCSIVDMVAEWSRGDGRLLPWFLGTSIYDDVQAYIDVSPIYHANECAHPCWPSTAPRTSCPSPSWKTSCTR